MRRVDVFRENAAHRCDNVDGFRINCPCGEMREEAGAGFIGREESQEFGHGEASREIQDTSYKSAEPEGESQKVGGESEDGERGGVEESPVGFGAEADVAQEENLKEGKGEREEHRPDQ